MDVNDDAAILNERGAFEFFASKLAPTEFAVFFIFRVYGAVHLPGATLGHNRIETGYALIP